MFAWDYASRQGNVNTVGFKIEVEEFNRPEGEAIVAAARQRFRPILLTSLTTFAGLTPLLLERSTHAQDLKPMAVTLAFGEIVREYPQIALHVCRVLSIRIRHLHGKISDQTC